MDNMRPHEPAALRAVQNQNQKPPASSNKPWRANSGATPPPPKVYRVEPREFRDLVQRLTGAPPPPARHHQTMMAPVPVRAAAAAAGGGDSQQQQHHQLYAPAAPWFSFPVDAHHGNGALM